MSAARPLYPTQRTNADASFNVCVGSVADDGIDRAERLLNFRQRTSVLTDTTPAKGQQRT